MKTTKTIQNLLVLGVAVAGLSIIAKPSYGALRFNGTDSKAVLDGHYLDGGTHST